MEDTLKEKNLTDKEQIQNDDARFKELNNKAENERSEDENKELGEIKERYSKRVQKRLDELTWKVRSSEEEQEKLRLENEKLRLEVEEAK